MKNLILLLLFSCATYSQNLTKDEIDKYTNKIKTNNLSNYSTEIFEGFYKKKWYLFEQPYSGSIVRDEQEVIIYIDEIFGDFKLIYEIYYKNENPIYILISKEKRSKQKKLYELYFINSKYIETIPSRKYKLQNVLNYANEFYLRESSKSR